jgi:hypothetical protein
MALMMTGRPSYGFVLPPSLPAIDTVLFFPALSSREGHFVSLHEMREYLPYAFLRAWTRCVRRPSPESLWCWLCIHGIPIPLSGQREASWRGEVMVVSVTTLPACQSLGRGLVSSSSIPSSTFTCHIFPYSGPEPSTSLTSLILRRQAPRSHKNETSHLTYPAPLSS